MKKMSLLQSYQLKYTISGFAWLVYAISRLFENIACKIVGILALAVVILSLVLASRGNEEEDEMSIMHTYKAKARSFDLIYGVVLLLSMISIVGYDFNFDFNKIYGFVIAAVNILIGCFFARLEKEGD